MTRVELFLGRAMTDCIFCKIGRGEIEAERILETDHAVAFLDIQPRSTGHSLVIPKTHFEKMADLDDETAADVFKVVRDVARMLMKALKPDGFTIGINDGEAAGQDIAHLHVNIIPRFIGDRGRSIHAVVSNPPVEEIRETAKRIRSVA